MVGCSAHALIDVDMLHYDALTRPCGALAASSPINLVARRLVGTEKVLTAVSEHRH
jgi:hypothetical protein